MINCQVLWSALKRSLLAEVGKTFAVDTIGEVQIGKQNAGVLVKVTFTGALQEYEAAIVIEPSTNVLHCSDQYVTSLLSDAVHTRGATIRFSNTVLSYIS